VWFHGRYGGSVEKKQKKVSFRTIFDKPELDPPQPVKARTLHYYSHRFYEERVKPRFLARWAAVSRLPNPPAVVTLRNKVTREAWEAESDEFKAEVLAAREADHQHALDAYSMAVSAEPPTTAEEYNV
jgi:poly(3-hydroxybutyrate) depolymerase